MTRSYPDRHTDRLPQALSLRQAVVLLVLWLGSMAFFFFLGLAMGRVSERNARHEQARIAAEDLQRLFRERGETEPAYRGVNAGAPTATPGALEIGGTVPSLELKASIIREASDRYDRGGIVDRLEVQQVGATQLQD